MTKQFNKENCIENAAKALGYETLEEIPHYDSINNLLCDLDIKEIEKIRDYMISSYSERGA